MLPRLENPRALLLVVLLAAACAPPDAGRPDYRLRAYLKVLAAEDTRHVAGKNLETLEAATASPDAFIRKAGVRALGRAEAPELLDRIAPLLGDRDVEVRAEAANAMAQAVHRGAGSAALAPLMSRLAHEEDPYVRGVLARSLGRLSLSPGERAGVARALVAASHGPDGGEAPQPQLEGAVLGMESFVRRARGEPVDTRLVARLRELIGLGLETRARTHGLDHIRSIAMVALAGTGEIGPDDVELGIRDPAPKTRRSATALLRVMPEPARTSITGRILGDREAPVRQEAVRNLARSDRDGSVCGSLLSVAAYDPVAALRVAALDALAVPCADTDPQIQVLTDIASSLAAETMDWHAPAHALVSLAAVSPASAAPLVPRFAGHENPFVRSYAALAAGRLGDTARLRTLAEDAVPNLQTTALTELVQTVGRSADPLLISTLGSANESQLVMTIATSLTETELKAEAASAALATLERLSAAGEQTLRDPRVALLGLIGRVGGPDLAPQIERYIRDSDRRIADLAAEILRDWTGDRYISAPRTPAYLALPTEDEMAELVHTSVVLHMARGGAITIELHPYLATTNSFRFVNMARAGVFDGLTLHRVVPNFVVQGGSPHANEYAGHGAFTRDEVGLPVQWRGTVGISTRGRDTGDGQIYFNLVDNVRLDHDYTIVGTVTEGMEVVDAVMEGDVIERAEVRIARQPAAG